MNLNVIIASSFVPVHPSIELTTKAIRALKFLQTKNKYNVIIANDGPPWVENTMRKVLGNSSTPRGGSSPEKDGKNHFAHISEERKKDWFLYLENLKSYADNFNEIEQINKIIISTKKTWGHKSGSIKKAIGKVNSKYILLLEHDIHLTRDIQIDKIIDDMEQNQKIKHLKFMISRPEKGEQKRSLIYQNWDARNDLFGKEEHCKNYTYTRTPVWSEQPHLCRTSYYNNLILPICEEGRAIENTMGNESKAWALFGNGESLRSNVSVTKNLNHRCGEKDLKLECKAEKNNLSPVGNGEWYVGARGSILEEFNEKYGMYLFGSLQECLDMRGDTAYGVHVGGDNYGGLRYCGCCRIE